MNNRVPTTSGRAIKPQRVLIAFGAMLLFSLPTSDAQVCPEASPPETHGSTELETFATGPDSSSVSWNAGNSALELTLSSGSLQPTGYTQQARYQCSAFGDFDSDGFPDLIVGEANSSGGGVNRVRLHLNKTHEMTACPGADCDSDGVDRAYNFGTNQYDPPLPDTVARRPKFTPSTTLFDLGNRLSNNKFVSVHCRIQSGDFNGDGNLDVASFRKDGTTAIEEETRLYFGDGTGGFRLGTGYGPDGSGGYTNMLVAAQTHNDVGCHNGTTPSVYADDYNGDGWLDMVFVNASDCNPNTRGKIMVMINDCPEPYSGSVCSRDPRFTSQLLFTLPNDNSYFTAFSSTRRGVSSIHVADVSGDGIEDMIMVSKSSPETVLVFGQPGIPKWDFSNPQKIVGPGEGTGVGLGDFDLDGDIDFVFGTEGQGNVVGRGECFEVDANNDGIPEGMSCLPGNRNDHGHYTYVFDNTGNAAAPFEEGWMESLPNAVTASGSLTANAPGLIDWDIVLAFDYDLDSYNTIDAFLNEGSGTGVKDIIANRFNASGYATCGYVASGPLSLGALSTADLSIDSAVVTPTPAPNLPGDSTIQFEASNDGGTTWSVMSDCDGAAPAGPDYCVTFSTVGTDVRWRAQLCATSDNTQTPQLFGVDASFGYSVADVHFTAGVVVSDGVALAGGYKQPKNIGRFFASNAGLTTTYFELGALIDAMADSTRDIYVAYTDSELMDLTSANASTTNLQSGLGTTGTTETDRLVTWFRDSRFGEGASATRLGAILSSTAAVATPPVNPYWYNLATSADKSVVDAFITSTSTRATVGYFGSMDGMLHAFDLNVSGGTATGAERWALIPNAVANACLSDEAAMNADNPPDNYPDGSPTLADVVFADNSMHTVLISGMGSGGRSVYAVDVTDPDAPDALWEIYPGGSGSDGAGFSKSKPVIARLNVGGTTRFAVILATSEQSGQVNRGRRIFAYDVETGATLWRFQSADNCYITTDIMAYETDDAGELGTPAKDGYVDFMIAGDSCGNLYKLDPNIDDGSWIESTTGKMGIGSIDSGTDVDSKDVQLFFSTSSTSGAIGATRPIGGTIGAVEQSDGRLVLYFGTGGVVSYPGNQVNEFYAVYADDGSIRDKITGSCTSAPVRCEKFYGGVVVTNEQVLLSRATDPYNAGGVCDEGSSVLEGFTLNSLGTSTFSQTVAGGASVSGLYGDSGAIYTTTMGGNLIRIGNTSAPNAGDGGSVGGGGSSGGGGAGVTGAALGVFGWRQVQ